MINSEPSSKQMTIYYEPKTIYLDECSSLSKSHIAFQLGISFQRVESFFNKRNIQPDVITNKRHTHYSFPLVQIIANNFKYEVKERTLKDIFL